MLVLRLMLLRSLRLLSVLLQSRLHPALAAAVLAATPADGSAVAPAGAITPAALVGAAQLLPHLLLMRSRLLLQSLLG